MENKKLTNEAGAPVAENEHSLTAGPRGPVMLQDVWLLEKLAHFDREVIPERRMHAKGWGAYGTLTVTHDISQWTKAKVLQPGAKTDLFIRFSTVAGERGAADAERDIRGVAVKFYTEEGNWDLVGNNTPTFFLRDVHNFPDLNRAVKRDPRTGIRSAQNNWDFWTLLPETFHQTTVVMSDRGIPASFSICIFMENIPSPSTMIKMNVYGASSTLKPSRESKTLRTRKRKPSSPKTGKAMAEICMKRLNEAIIRAGQCMYRS